MHDPPTLTIPDVQYGGDIGTKTVTFEFPPSEPVEISESIRTGYLVDGRGSRALALLDEFRDAGEGGRKGVHVDLGGGVHTWELSADTPVTSPRSDGQLHQWGYTQDDSVLDGASATGADANTQMSVLMNAFVHASPDSLTPATWSVGEYHADGVLAPREVVIEQPTVVQESDRPQTADINLTLIETADLQQSFDKQRKLG